VAVFIRIDAEAPSRIDPRAEGLAFPVLSSSGADYPAIGRPSVPATISKTRDPNRSLSST
jgi:hypothetical protein